MGDMTRRIEDLIKDQPGETRAEKVANLKKEAEGKRGPLSINPLLNTIDRLDAEGNPPKRGLAKPISGGAASAKPVKPSAGGGSGGAASNTREMQLGSELDPKAMMKREGMKKGGKVSSASSRADGIAQRGKTKGRIV